MNTYESQRVGAGNRTPIKLANSMDIQRQSRLQNSLKLNKNSPLQPPGFKYQQMRAANNASMPLPRQNMRPIDDQSINHRIRQLQEQKNEIAYLASKYQLEDNSRVPQLTLLTLANPKTGLIHGNKFSKNAANNNQDIQASDRVGRQAEYHKMTNERRKQINVRIQKKREREQRE